MLFKDESPTSDGFVTVVTLDPGLTSEEGKRARTAVDREFDAMLSAMPGAKGQTGGLSELISAITGRSRRTCGSARASRCRSASC